MDQEEMLHVVEPERSNENDRQDAADDDEDGSESADEALTELLGLPSVDALASSCWEEKEEGAEGQRGPPLDTIETICRVRTEEWIETVMIRDGLRETYQNTSVCILSDDLSIPAAMMRRLADEVVLWSSSTQSPTPLPNVQRTYETIVVTNHNNRPVGSNDGTSRMLVRKRELTRLENLRGHDGWRILCDAYIARIASVLLQRHQSLYKTKLNLKPPGGNGFAPHVDAPSLQLPFADYYGSSSNHDDDNAGSSSDAFSSSFITIMIAIDDMTIRNGCLRVAPRPLSAGPVTLLVAPHGSHNPDGDGRAGALIDGENYDYINIECRGGSIVAFDGWVPHRSGVNHSAFGRRAVFLTYHDNAIWGDNWHDLYYERMGQLRQNYLAAAALATRTREQLPPGGEDGGIGATQPGETPADDENSGVC
jgi:2-aminoethylphosphonate dioxygenase